MPFQIPDQADGLRINNNLDQLASPDAVLRNEQRNQQYQTLLQAPKQAAMAKKAAMGKELDSFIAMSGGTPQALQAAQQKAIMSGVFTPDEIKQSTAMYSQYATDAERVQHATASVADFDKWYKEQMVAKKPLVIAPGSSLMTPGGVTLGSVPPKPEKSPDWQNPAYVNYENQKAKFAAGLKPDPVDQWEHVITADNSIVQVNKRTGETRNLGINGQGKNGGQAPSRIQDANDSLKILSEAEPLLAKSTHSGLGNLVDSGSSFFGGSTEGADTAAQLKVLGGALVSKMPKMSGPQSDKDVLLYKEMAGKIGDPTVPTSQKRAAMQEIKRLQQYYAGMPQGQQSPAANPHAGKSDAQIRAELGL